MATLHAYLAYSSLKPADLIGMPLDKLVRHVALSTHGTMHKDDARWIHVGTAEVASITLDPIEAIVNGQINALRKKQADLTAAATAIEGEIQKLLAITNEVAA